MSFNSLLNQTITLYNKSGYNSAGEISYGVGVEYLCRFEPMTKRVMGPDGNVLTIDAMVMAKPGMPAASDDRITYNSVDYKVVDVFPVPDDMGNTHHLELRLLKWPIST